VSPEEQALATVVKHLEALGVPEDTVLSKLEWALKAGGSEKQLADVAGVLDVQADALDRTYIERRVGELGIRELWLRVSAARRS
jgi:hypothetical protein